MKHPWGGTASTNRKTALKKSLHKTGDGFLGNLFQMWQALALPEAAELPAFPVHSIKTFQI